MKKLIFILSLILAASTVDAGPFSTQPKTKQCGQTYIKKQTKNSLKFAKVINRKMNKKGLRK